MDLSSGRIRQQGLVLLLEDYDCGCAHREYGCGDTHIRGLSCFGRLSVSCRLIYNLGLGICNFISREGEVVVGLLRTPSYTISSFGFKEVVDLDRERNNIAGSEVTYRDSDLNYIRTVALGGSCLALVKIGVV